MHDPLLIFLDEPFSGLDPVNTELFRSIIRELVDDGRYIVMSSHQMSTVEEYCENLVILDRGRTVLSGNLKEIKASYGRTRLAVNSSPVAKTAADALGLKAIEERADYTEYRINGDGDAKKLMDTMIDAGEYPSYFVIREPSLHEIFLDKVGGVDE